MQGSTTLIALFVFTVLAGLAGAIWEWLGITRELKMHGDPQGGPGWDNHLKRKAESMARKPLETESPRVGIANSLPLTRSGVTGL